MVFRRVLEHTSFALVCLLLPLANYKLCAQDQLPGQSPALISIKMERHPDAVPRRDCFPLETLSDPELRKLSNKLLQDAMDSEAIYTLLAIAKPVSEGFWNTRFRIAPPNITEVERVQHALSAWQCGDLFLADTLVFENLIEGERHASAWVCNRLALRQLIESQTNYFGRLGVTARENPEVVLLSIERSQIRDERWRGFGLVFGYPEYSIDFFVRAGLHQAETGQFIERDFRSFPTFAGKTGRFVYAVPKLSDESDSEKKFRVQAERIQKYYAQIRAEYIGDEKPGPAVLIRDWFDDGSGYCHPSHALLKCDAAGHDPVQTKPSESIDSPAK